MFHAVTTGAYYPPVEDFDHRSILVDSGSIVHALERCKKVRGEFYPGTMTMDTMT